MSEGAALANTHVRRLKSGSRIPLECPMHGRKYPKINRLCSKDYGKNPPGELPMLFGQSTWEKSGYLTRMERIFVLFGAAIKQRQSSSGTPSATGVT